MPKDFEQNLPVFMVGIPAHLVPASDGGEGFSSVTQRPRQGSPIGVVWRYFASASYFPQERTGGAGLGKRPTPRQPSKQAAVKRR